MDREFNKLFGVTGGFGSDRDEDCSWDASVLYSKWEQDLDEEKKYSETLIRVSLSMSYHPKRVSISTDSGCLQPTCPDPIGGVEPTTA